MRHLKGGEFVREAHGRSPLSKWVYYNTCQAAKPPPPEKQAFYPPIPAKPENRGDTGHWETGKRLPDEVYHTPAATQQPTAVVSFSALRKEAPAPYPRPRYTIPPRRVCRADHAAPLNPPQTATAPGVLRALLPFCRQRPGLIQYLHRELDAARLARTNAGIVVLAASSGRILAAGSVNRCRRIEPRRPIGRSPCR